VDELEDEMPKKAPKIEIEEISGNKYKSLDEAWHAPLTSESLESAITLAAKTLLDTVKKLLREHRLIEINGKIVPNPDDVNGEK
jgi:hypothetical protein